MKKYIIYSLIITLTCGLGACNNDEDVDKANSIFSTEEVERSPFDNWILGNYPSEENSLSDDLKALLNAAGKREPEEEI